jgi:hypothetical protein
MTLLDFLKPPLEISRKEKGASIISATGIQFPRNDFEPNSGNSTSGRAGIHDDTSGLGMVRPARPRPETTKKTHPKDQKTFEPLGVAWIRAAFEAASRRTLRDRDNAGVAWIRAALNAASRRTLRKRDDAGVAWIRAALDAVSRRTIRSRDDSRVAWIRAALDAARSEARRVGKD